jgi:iron complex transport system substrate-binding protein
MKDAPKKEDTTAVPLKVAIMPDAMPRPLLSNLSIMSLELRASILAEQKKLPEAKKLFVIFICFWRLASRFVYPEAAPMNRFQILLAIVLTSLLTGCGRFGSKATDQGGHQRIVCIGQTYNEMIYALGAQANLVGVDYSSTFPPEIKKLPTVGYHRALSAEGILSLKPTLIIEDNNIGPDNVVRQLQALQVPMKTFHAKNDSIEGTKALLREMGAFFHKEQRAEELCSQMDREMADAAVDVKKYQTSPRVAVIHFGRASNVYLLVGNGGGGDASTAGKMVELAGGQMAVQQPGMQRMVSPEIIAKINPQVILMTEYGFDHLGSVEQAKTLPGVAQTDAAKNNRIYRVPEHDLMYFGPDTGESIIRLAQLVHQ